MLGASSSFSYIIILYGLQFTLCVLGIQPLVSEIQTQIGKHHPEIQKIEHKYVPFGRKIRHIRLIQKFGNDPRHISEQDQAQKCKTFPLRRPCPCGFDDIHRPRYAKADDHNNLEKLCHCFLPLKITDLSLLYHSLTDLSSSARYFSFPKVG